MAFVGILSQIKLLFVPLVIQLVWYILKQLFSSVSAKVADISQKRLGLSKVDDQGHYVHSTIGNDTGLPISCNHMRQNVPNKVTFLNPSQTKLRQVLS